MASASINSAIEAFGDLHVLVNNAGILRDRVLVNMTEGRVGRGRRGPPEGPLHPHPLGGRLLAGADQGGQDRSTPRSSTRRRRRACSRTRARRTTARPSPGIATFSQICAKELSRYGVRSNAITPAARTRLTLSTPGLGERIAEPTDAARFDEWDPANISPLVAYLATADCPFTGATFYVQGGMVKVYKSWELGEGIDQDARWSVAELAEAMRPLADLPYAQVPELHPGVADPRSDRCRHCRGSGPQPASGPAPGPSSPPRSPASSPPA